MVAAWLRAAVWLRFSILVVEILKELLMIVLGNIENMRDAKLLHEHCISSVGSVTVIQERQDLARQRRRNIDPEHEIYQVSNERIRILVPSLVERQVH